MTELNEAIFRSLHGLLREFSWLENLVAFGSKPIWQIPIAPLDSVLMATTFFVLFLYYDGRPGIFKISKYTWRKLAIISLAGIIAWSVAMMAKEIWLIPRPYIAMADIVPLFRLGVLDSFPSGHATFFSAVAVAVYHYHRKLGALFVLATIIIGLTRIIAGVHYPIDILGGFLLGGGGAWIMAIILQTWPAGMARGQTQNK